MIRFCHTRNVFISCHLCPFSLLSPSIFPFRKSHLINVIFLRYVSSFTKTFLILTVSLLHIVKIIHVFFPIMTFLSISLWEFLVCFPHSWCFTYVYIKPTTSNCRTYSHKILSFLVVFCVHLFPFFLLRFIALFIAVVIFFSSSFL